MISFIHRNLEEPLSSLSRSALSRIRNLVRLVLILHSLALRVGRREVPMLWTSVLNALPIESVPKLY